MNGFGHNTEPVQQGCSDHVQKKNKSIILFPKFGIQEITWDEIQFAVTVNLRTSDWRS